MQNPAFDPGLTNQFSGTLRRAINSNGTFNVRRRGISWRDTHPYLRLISMSWPEFLSVVFLGYILANTGFALLYLAVGSNEVSGADAPTWGGRFLNEFFFSAQTLTTVGYGSMAPRALGANVVAALESLVGVLGFALGTGLLYGRVSKPSARVGFSANALVAPYQDISGLEFRVVNRRENVIMEVEAQVILMTVERAGESLKRNYTVLNLERTGVVFLPITWTIVHPIVKDSPLYGKSAADLEAMQAELLVQLKGYDDTFSQSVHARYSYRYDEIVWGARFTPAFEIDPEGSIEVYVDRISNYRPAELPALSGSATESALP